MERGEWRVSDQHVRDGESVISMCVTRPENGTKTKLFSLFITS